MIAFLIKIKIKIKIYAYFATRKMLRVIMSDIASKYSLYIVNISSLPNGFVHLNYKCVTNKNKSIVLRIYRNCHLNEIKAETQLLDQLSTHPAIQKHIVTMIQDNNGQKVGQVGKYFYSLFEYIENDPITYLDLAQANNVANILRKIHDIGVHLCNDFKDRTLVSIEQVTNTLSNFYSKKIVTRNEYGNLMNIAHAYGELITKYQQNTILHCDVHRNNLLLDKTTNNLVIIDFNDFCVGPAIIDLAIMMRMLCLERNIFDIAMAKQIFYGYYSTSPGNVQINVNDLLIFMLFNLVFCCEYYLQVGHADNYEQFHIAYNKILILQKSANRIIKELSIFNHTTVNPSSLTKSIAEG